MPSIERYCEVFSERFQRKSNSPEMRYLRFLIEEFERTRNERVIDLKLSDMVKARVVMERMFSFPIESMLPCLCIDGRVLSETVFCLPLESFRTPAADVSDALLLNDGTLHLANGDFTESVRTRVDRYGKAIVILDSHSHCAAKGEEKKLAFGVPALDGGLSDDVRRKKLIAEAIYTFVEREYGSEGKEKISVIQTTFDVHSGFLFMGLEREDVLSDPRVIQEGFTERVLEVLARERKILSSKLFVEEGGILFETSRSQKRLLRPLEFERRGYARSMLSFWKSLESFSVSNGSLSEIHGEVCRVFPSLKEESADVQTRALLLLSNALLGSLLNVSGSYPYKDHRETVVVVTNRARGPYETAVPFPVNEYHNGGMATLLFVVGFAASIARDNRSKNRLPEGERPFLEACFGNDTGAIVKSPVPVFISERITEDLLPEMVELLARLNWEESSWVSSHQCKKFLQENVPGVSSEVILGIERLRERSLEMYRPGLPATGNFLSGQLALVPTLRTAQGKIIAVFPFLLSGYSKKYLKSIGKM